MFERINQGQQEGSYSNRSVVDGIERLYYYRKIPQYLLANHNRAKEALFLQAALMSLLILALTLALTRHLRQIRREMGIRHRAQRQIEERNEQLNAIFDLSPDGFVSFDGQRCVKYISPAFMQLTGPGSDQLEGMAEQDFSTWLAQRCAPGTPFVGIIALRAQVTGGNPGQREAIFWPPPRTSCVPRCPAFWVIRKSCSKVYLQELLADLIESFPLPSGRFTPALDLPAPALYLMADADKLRQALLNVISNAYKYSPNGGAVQVKAWASSEPGQPLAVCIEITDSGIGMTPAQLARVCERFYRADASGKILGTGLGMSIVKEIIELHGGSVSLYSTLGKGTCVSLTLPGASQTLGT
jgi:nitrogen fixation/metabolism regulation signal transduction histidine kinase